MYINIIVGKTVITFLDDGGDHPQYMLEYSLIL